MPSSSRLVPSGLWNVHRRGGANREPRKRERPVRARARAAAVFSPAPLSVIVSRNTGEVSVRTLKNPREDDNGETRCVFVATVFREYFQLLLVLPARLSLSDCTTSRRRSNQSDGKKSQGSVDVSSRARIQEALIAYARARARAI